jgi:flagellar protein FlaG
MITAPIDGGLGRIAPKGSPEAAASSQAKQEPVESQQQQPAVIGMASAGTNGAADRIDLSREAAAKSAEMRGGQASAEESAPAPTAQLADQVREQVRQFQQRATSVQFSVDDQNGELLIRIVNRESGEVIRQIPPEEVLKLQERLRDFRGLLLHEVS